MRIRILLLLLALACAAGAQVQQYHDPLYLMGGYSSTSTFYWNGVWLADLSGTTPSLKHLTPNDRFYFFYSMTMDADNKRIVVLPRGTTSTFYASYHRSGIYRVDPNTLQVTTVLMDTVNLYYPYHLLVNQDGDYVVVTQQRLPSTQYAVLKVSNDGSTITTLLTRGQVGGSGSFFYDLGVDMDSGHYLIPFSGTIVSSLGTFRNPVLIVADDGTVVGTFSGPGYAGYWSFDGLEQDFATGDVEWQYFGYLYRLKRGGSLTTVLRYGWMGGQWNMQYNSRHDLQSAATPRLVGDAQEYRLIGGIAHYLPGVFYASLTSPVAQFLAADPNNTAGFRYYYSYAFEFYRGRHISSGKAGTNKWQIQVSCPSFPGHFYLMALSLTGYRPPFKLADGRKIYLVPDNLTFLSLQNLLKPVFDPGPGKLNAAGEAVATLDLSAFGKLGVPLWIAVVILDAQGRIVYIPDTYVMRI